MADCSALAAGTLQALPLVGDELGAAASWVGDTVVAGAMQGDPVSLAIVAVALVMLGGLYQVTRIGASFVALTGFFMFVLCSV